MSATESRKANDQQRPREGVHTAGPQDDNNIVRLIKPVLISDESPGPIDESMVSAEFYNRFTYSLLSKGSSGVNLTVGITSANAGEGKTVVASNLAVSLAVANRRNTVLVDLSILNPRLHSVFGTPRSPGLLEAIDGQPIRVFGTRIDHLHVLPSGAMGRAMLGVAPPSPEDAGIYNNELPALGLDKVVVFRDIIYSLREHFEFVIIDMPVLEEPRVPLILTHQMDGLFVVIDATRTKHRDVEKMFRHLNSNQVLGFVFNRTSEENHE